MSSQSFRIPVASYRRLDTPSGNNPKKQNSVALVNVKDLPDLNNWRKVNVREVKKTGRVPRAIRDSLYEHPDFHFMNRGLVINVDRIDFDQRNSILTITLTKPEYHGLLDGGHTYEIIMDERDSLEDDRYVKIELLRGFDTQEIIDIVGARNTSNQVQDKSLMNLEGKFGPIQELVKGTPYADRIAYKENEDKDIDIREIISYLYPFHVTYHVGRAQPIHAYRSKAQCLNHFRDHRDDFAHIYPIAKDILELWDYIHLYFPHLYNEARGGGRFGGLTGVSVAKHRDKPVEKVLLYFIERKSQYKITDAAKYPILAAFRAFVEIDKETGDYFWGKGIKPVEMLEGPLGQSLALKVGESLMDTRNSNKTGKSALLWESCYQAARIEYLEYC